MDTTKVDAILARGYCVIRQYLTGLKAVVSLQSFGQVRTTELLHHNGFQGISAHSNGRKERR